MSTRLTRPPADQRTAAELRQARDDGDETITDRQISDADVNEHRAQRRTTRTPGGTPPATDSTDPVERQRAARANGTRTR